MKNDKNISKAVICRIPGYYRFLCSLLENGTQKISSGELAALMGVTASQIRQDFNCFGGFGQQGYGYSVQSLVNEMAEILGLGYCVPAILIGAGNLGRGIANSVDFNSLGFELTAIFDSDKMFTGLKVKGLPVRSTEELEYFCMENKPQAAILCEQNGNARKTAEKLTELGIHAFWNFTECCINDVFPGITVENVCLSDSLMTLSYRFKNGRQ